MGILYHLLQPPVQRPRSLRLVVTLGSLALAIGARILLDPWLRWHSPFALLLPAVLVSAWYGGARAGLLATAVAGFAAVSVFMVPAGLPVRNASDAVAFLLFITEGMLVSGLCAVLHHAVNRAQEAAAEAGRKFEDMANHAPVLIWSTDVADNCVFVNRTWLTFTGRPWSEECGAGWLANVHPDDLALYRGHQAAARAQNLPGQLEYRRRRADGSWRWLLEHAVPRHDADGRFEGLTGSCTDITDSRREREELDFVARLQRRLVTSLDLERVADALAAAALPRLGDWFRLELVHDNGRLETLRLHHLDRAGADETDLLIAGLGSSATVVETGEMQFTPRVERPATARFPGGRPPAPGPVSHLAVPLFARGRITGVLTLATAGSGRVLGPEDAALVQKIAGIAGFALDNARTCAELTTTREELRHHADELETRVRQRTATLRETNAELEAFTYSVSHDLRTPLQFIRSFAAAMGEDRGNGLTHDSRDYLTRILQAAARMESIIHDLLDYSRLTRADMALGVISLEEAVAEAVSHQQVAIQRTGARLYIDSALPHVLADRTGLFQVLTNLLSNALKFSRPGQTPVIRLRAEAGPEGGVRLWIGDNGIGIPSRHQEKIFQLFERLHPASEYPGTGIGLALVRKAVYRMGGRCGVESSPGNGSNFWIDFQAGELPGASDTPGPLPDTGLVPEPDGRPARQAI